MVLSKEWNDCIKCNKRVFSDESNIYCNNIYCEKCLNIIKKTEPTYKINIIIFDGTNIDINIKPKKATFESIMKQIQDKIFKKESISHETHSLILNGNNMTRTELPRIYNAFVNGLRNNDKLYLIKNDVVNLKINKLNGDTLLINKSIEDIVCGVMFEIEKKYRIPEGLQTLFLNDIELDIGKTLFYYDISNTNNNTLSLIVKQDKTFTSEFLMLMKENAFEYSKTHNHFNINEFQQLTLQKALDNGIDPLRRDK